MLVLLQEAAAAAVARGKRGKAKKAQTKYAHQDEEDKALALQLLDPAGRVFGSDYNAQVKMRDMQSWSEAIAL